MIKKFILILIKYTITRQNSLKTILKLKFTSHLVSDNINFRSIYKFSSDYSN